MVKVLFDDRIGHCQQDPASSGQEVEGQTVSQGFVGQLGFKRTGRLFIPIVRAFGFCGEKLL